MNPIEWLQEAMYSIENNLIPEAASYLECYFRWQST